MLDEAKASIVARIGQEFLQPGLPLRKRQCAQVLAAVEEQVECEIDQRVCLAIGQSRLKRGESGAPFSSSAQISPSMIVSGRFAAARAIAGYLAVQSKPFRVFSVASPSSTRIWMR